VSEFQEYVDFTMDDRVEEDQLDDKICDVGVESFPQAHVYGSIFSAADTFLYTGSTNFTWLLVVLILLNFKAING